MNRSLWMPIILVALLTTSTSAKQPGAVEQMPEWAFDVAALLLHESGSFESIGTEADSRSLAPAAQRAIAIGWCVAQLAAQGYARDGYDGVWLTCTGAASFDGPWVPGMLATLPRHGMAARLRTATKDEVTRCVVAMLEGDLKTLRVGNAFEAFCVPILRGDKPAKKRSKARQRIRKKARR